MNVAKARCVEVDVLLEQKKYVGKVQRRDSGIAN